MSKLNKLPDGKGISVNSFFLMMMLETDDYSEICKDDDIDYNDISPVLSIHN